MQVEYKRMMKKEYIYGVALLLIPLIITLLVMKPVHEEYITPGDIVPVSEVGVDGSVYFTYVNSGFVRNLYHKFSLMLVYKDQVSFTPVEFYTQEEEEEYFALNDYYRTNTIEHAVEHAHSSGNVSETVMSQKLQEIMSSTEGYYGDSFGLMLGLGLIEEWNQEDFSHDGRYKIAGTGTLEEDQSVGSIGAIPEKLETAEKNQVDYFFIPKDKHILYGISNQEEAEEYVKEHHYRLQLVPVENLDEALDFLRRLPN